jgi:Na+/melibiose symporter-like transporter
MPQLIAARILQGLGGGGLRSVSQAAIADVIPPRERGLYQGYLSSVMAIAMVLGPVLGGFFVDYLSWHWIFWINIPFGLVALVLCDRNLRRLPLPRGRAIIDWFGAVLLVGATIPVLLALSRAESGGSWRSPAIMVQLGLGAAFLIALVAWEREARSPLIPLRLFANRIFAVASLISFTMSMVMIALIILVPLAFEIGAGLSANQAGMRLIPMTGGTVLGSFIAGRLMTRSGRYRIYPIGGAGAMTLFCGALALIGVGRSVVLDTVLTAGLGLSFGFQLAPVIVPVQNALPLEDTGVGLGTVMFFRLIGGAFGVALLTAVLMAELNIAAAALPGLQALGDDPGLVLLQMELSGTASPALIAGLAQASHTAFAHVFLYAGAIAGLTFLASFGLKEIPLRSG